MLYVSMEVIRKGVINFLQNNPEDKSEKPCGQYSIEYQR